MEKIRYLAKQIGFWQTFEILSEKDTKTMTMKKFYEALNKNSYYNAFLRVKDFLLEHDLIEIRKVKGSKGIITLTIKGVVLWNKLKQVNKILEMDIEIEIVERAMSSEDIVFDIQKDVK